MNEKLHDELDCIRKELELAKTTESKAQKLRNSEIFSRMFPKNDKELEGVRKFIEVNGALFKDVKVHDWQRLYGWNEL